MSGKKLWKPEFDDMVYEKLKEMSHYYPREVVYWVNKAFVECMVDAIENGDSIQVHRTFSLQPRLAAEHRIGNFGKGELVIPEHYVADFKPYSRIKKACEKLMENENKSEEEECLEE